MRNFFLFAFLFASQANADTCVGYKTNLIKSFVVGSDVNYFIRGSGSANLIGLITPKSNNALNVLTGEIVELPGDVDPVPTPDGKYFSIPAEFCIWPGRPAEFMYRMSETDRKRCFESFVDERGVVLTNGQDGLIHRVLPGAIARTPYSQRKMIFIRGDHDLGPGAKTILSDGEVIGDYQSIGILKSDAKSSIYRMLYVYGDAEGRTGLKIRDYRSDQMTGKLEVNSAVKHICPELDNDKINLPMISKDGTEFSGYDAVHDKTLIYKINPLGGKCQIAAEIAVQAGKTDFNPSTGDAIFHVDTAGQQAYAFQTPTGFHLKLAIFDRKTKEILPVETAPNEDAYYPVFMGNDRITYISTFDVNGKSKYKINTATIQRCGASSQSSAAKATPTNSKSSSK